MPWPAAEPPPSPVADIGLSRLVNDSQRQAALAAITRGLGMVAARLNAQLVLRRLVYVGDGPHAEEAVRRRGRARFRQGMWSDAEHYRPNARARTGA